MTEESLFELALETPQDERSALLERHCGGDARLRARVEALLAADREAAGWLTGARDATGPFVRPHVPEGSAPAEPLAGTVIAGRYKLLQMIGEGGMGSVWLAQQQEPVKRRVAVKLIRAERGSSRAILARFEAERQAIALMDHPHIARLLDAGTTPGPDGTGLAGQPFFVMELVQGVPLIQFCDEHRLSMPDRLKLFIQICSAVQHAHHKGIIHRDLKPGNILVESHDGKPVPRVIDFGLAKATGGLQLTEQSLFTAFGSVVGTPLYMAPEQASFDAVDVDTRADVYALGVILYELLTGTTPLTRETLKQAALDEVFRRIREQEPPAPSSRISSSEARPPLADHLGESVKLGRFVKGELDWIVLKALAKERDRRYETASNFARDIERFLCHDPVSAGPPSPGYRFRKFVQRNRLQVVAAAVVLLTLLLGMAGTVFGLIRANEERARAVTAAEQEREAKEEEKNARLKETQERQYAEAMASFVRDDFLALTSVEGQDRFGGAEQMELNPNLTLLQMLDRAAVKLESHRNLAPRIEADLRWIIGVNYRGQGEPEKAVRHLQRCQELRRQTLGVDHRAAFDAQNSLAFAYQRAGKLDRAVALLEEADRSSQKRQGLRPHGLALLRACELLVSHGV